MMPVKAKAESLPQNMALVINNLKAGGAERVLTTLANTWVCRGRKVCVITLSDTGSDFFSLEPGIKRVVIGMPLKSKNRLSGLFYSLRRICCLRRVLIESGAHVVVTFLPVLNILTTLATIGLNVRLIISERNDPQRQLLGWPWDSLRKFLYGRADMVTANSRGVIDKLKSHVPANKLCFVPNPVCVPPLSDSLKKTGPTILAVGSLTPQKAQDVLLDSFAMIASRIPEWRLAIVGEGPLKHDLQAKAGRLGIADRVDWHGLVTDPFRYYRAADIAVLPSRFEGTPNALLEAMSCGLPVIVSDASPGPLEYVEHEKSGLVVPVEDAEALACALRRLTGDERLRDRLGTVARTRLTECELKKVLEVWEHVLGFDGRPGAS